MAGEMTFRSETRTADSGATVETGTVEVAGKAFSALGSVVDPARGLVMAYVREAPDASMRSGKRYELVTWEGSLIAPLTLVRRFTSYGIVRTTLFAWRATYEGRVYSGRNAGPARRGTDPTRARTLLSTRSKSNSIAMTTETTSPPMPKWRTPNESGRTGRSARDDRRSRRARFQGRRQATRARLPDRDLRQVPSTLVAGDPGRARAHREPLGPLESREVTRWQVKATELDLGDLRARRLSVGTSKTLRASTETWVAHEPGDPFASVGQSKRELAAHPKPCDCIDCSIAGKPTH